MTQKRNYASGSALRKTDGIIQLLSGTGEKYRTCILPISAGRGVVGAADMMEHREKHWNDFYLLWIVLNLT